MDTYSEVLHRAVVEWEVGIDDLQKGYGLVHAIFQAWTHLIRWPSTELLYIPPARQEGIALGMFVHVVLGN